LQKQDSVIPVKAARMVPLADLSLKGAIERFSLKPYQLISKHARMRARKVD
jgi:hypothetical protein